MRKLLGLLMLLPFPALAAQPVEKYTEHCAVNGRPSVCVVVDTRTPNGFLDTRSIYNDQYGYTMKQRFVGAKGFVTWDSVTNAVYKYPYRVVNGAAQVTPHLTIVNVSWD